MAFGSSGENILLQRHWSGGNSRIPQFLWLSAVSSHNISVPYSCKASFCWLILDKASFLQTIHTSTRRSNQTVRSKLQILCGEHCREGEANEVTSRSSNIFQWGWVRVTIQNVILGFYNPDTTSRRAGVSLATLTYCKEQELGQLNRYLQNLQWRWCNIQ